MCYIKFFIFLKTHCRITTKMLGQICCRLVTYIYQYVSTTHGSQNHTGVSAITRTKLYLYHVVKCVTLLLVTLDTHVTSSNLIFILMESSLELPIKQRICFNFIYTSYASV
jgi:hypothetical protein